MVGETIQQYRVVAPIGEGGMGVVYKGWDTRLERFVALKLLQQREDVTVEQRKRFLREARAASALNHPAIVSVYEVIQQDGLDVIVMEFVDGKPLADLIPDRGLPIDTALDYASEVLDALSKAHSAHFMHRDLKPGNIMIADGRVKLLDFGLAKRTEDATGPDVTNTVLTVGAVALGTPSYMSPEQAMGDRIDHRTDIFSFGIVLYEMLAGVRPFRGTTNVATIQQVVAATPEPLEKVRPDVPLWLARVIAKCLQKNPDERFRSAEDLRRMLKSGREGRLDTAEIEALPRWREPATPKKPAAAGPRRKLLAAVAGILITAAGIGYWAVNRKPAAPPPEPPLNTSLPALDLIRLGFESLAASDEPGKIDRAVEAFQLAVKKEPRSAPAHAGLALALVARRSMQQALESANQAVSLDAESCVAHTALGAAQGENGEAALRRAIQLDPADLEANLRLARLTRDDSLLDKAAQLAPDDWRVDLARGETELRRGQYLKAAGHLEQAQRRVPRSVAVQAALGTVYEKLGRTEDALAAFQKANEIGRSAAVNASLAELYAARGKHAEAAAALARAVEIDPENHAYWGALAAAYDKAPETKEKAKEAGLRAAQLAGSLLTERPADLELRAERALHWISAGRNADAAADLATLDNAAQHSTEVLFRMAEAHERLGDRRRALRLLDVAFKSGLSPRRVEERPAFVNLRSDPVYPRLAMQAASQKK